MDKNFVRNLEFFNDDQEQGKVDQKIMETVDQIHALTGEKEGFRAEWDSLVKKINHVDKELLLKELSQIEFQIEDTEKAIRLMKDVLTEYSRKWKSYEDRKDDIADEMLESLERNPKEKN